MIYVISKATFGSYDVRDIQCNANWDCCPYSDYALIPESMVDDILATKGYCDITLNDAGTEVLSYTARSIPTVQEECCGTNTVLSVNGVTANTDGAVTLTPDNVGAAPAGYGCGERNACAQNWNSHFRSGFYKERANSPDGNTLWYGISCVSYYGESANIAFNPNSTNGFTMALRHQGGGKFEEWEYVNPPMVQGVEYRTTERRNGKAVYKRLNSNDALEYRLDGESTWYPYINHIGAAPAGYGLGEANGRRCADCNTALNNGFYNLSGENCQNVPTNAQHHYGTMIVERRGDTIIHQTVNRCNILIRRYSGDGGSTWTEWEWENPPLAESVEYRTTERFNNKPVYAKRINFGSGTTRAVDITTDTIDSLVRVEGCWVNGDIKELFTSNYIVTGVSVDRYDGASRLRVEVNAVATNYTGYPVVYYTKS